MAGKDTPQQSVGPDYRSDKQKPIATVSKEVSFANVHTLAQTPQLIALLTYVSVSGSSAPAMPFPLHVFPLRGLHFDSDRVRVA